MSVDDLIPENKAKGNNKKKAIFHACRLYED